MRLLVYGGLLSGTIYLARTLQLVDRLPRASPLLCGFLFAAYMVLLYMEVRAGVRRGETQARLQWTGFGFTTGVGIMWAFALSTYRGTIPMLEGPLQFVAFLLGYVVVGAMWGVLGAVLTLLILKLVFRKKSS
jgi:hypothetical protein